MHLVNSPEVAYSDPEKGTFAPVDQVQPLFERPHWLSRRRMAGADYFGQRFIRRRRIADNPDCPNTKQHQGGRLGHGRDDQVNLARNDSQ